MVTTIRVDRVGRLLDLAVVPRWLTRSFLLGIALYFVGALGATAIWYADRPQVFATFVLPHLPIIAIAVWMAVSVLRPAGWLARIGIAVLLLVPLAWTASAALALAARIPAGWLWIVPAAFRLVFLAWLGVELFVGTLALLRASRAEAALAAEPRLGAALMGAPPALAEIAAGRAGARALFLLAALMFAFAVLQAFALNISPDVTWQAAIAACDVPDAAKAACLAANAQGELFGQLVVWPLGFAGPIVIARWIEARARRRVRDTAAAAMARNTTAAPILFLRAFRNDQVALPASRPSPMRWLLQRTRKQHYLDHMLVEEFAIYGPTVALGRPGQEVPPFGVWRDYLHDATDAVWQAEVARLAQAARAVVMVADDGRGVAWELEHLAAANLLHKTLFVAPPDCAEQAANARLWQSVEAATGLAAASAAASGPAVLAMFRAADGSLQLATSERFVASDYLAVLRWFIRAGAPAP